MGLLRSESVPLIVKVDFLFITMHLKMIMQSLIPCCVAYCGNDKKKKRIIQYENIRKMPGVCVHNHSEIPEKNSLDH